MRFPFHLAPILLVAVAPVAAADISSAPDLSDQPPLQPGGCGLYQWQVRCAEEGPCDVLDATICWAVRLACWGVGYPLEKQGVGCQMQPGCCDSAGGGSPPQAEGNCNNYGVEVTLVVGDGGDCHAYKDEARTPSESCNNYGVEVMVHLGHGDPCTGEPCGNSGLQVVVGTYCDRGTRVCAQDRCIRPCAPVAADTTLVEAQAAAVTGPLPVASATGVLAECR